MVVETDVYRLCRRHIELQGNGLSGVDAIACVHSDSHLFNMVGALECSEEQVAVPRTSTAGSVTIVCHPSTTVDADWMSV